MSNTDSAFIKVYQHHTDHGTPAPMMAGGVRVRDDGIVIASNRSTVTQVVASATAPTASTTQSATSDLIAAAPTEAITRESTARATQGKTSSTVAFTDSEPQTQKSKSWRDPAHGAIPAPHLDAARFKQSTVASRPPSRPQFRPAWEVDRFQWPEICEQLQREWSSALTSIVKSVVREAWRGSNIVGVTQFARAEGATTLALCLARIAASFHIKVALVDGNTQHPDIGGALGLRVEHGWEPTAAGHSLEESAIRSLEDRLVVFPLADPPTEATQDTGYLASVLERLGDNFELVVVDTGPVFVAAHHWFAPALCGKLGSALVVQDIRRTESTQVNDVCSRLRAADVSNISIVENFQST